MARFVILKHEMPPGADRLTHWDFMLEAGDVLWTWALGQPPAVGETLEARRLADHRTAYLDYEGAVSGDRGTVDRWDTGTYQTEFAGDRQIVVVLHGVRLTARVRLTCDGHEVHRWRLVVEPAT